MFTRRILVILAALTALAAYFVLFEDVRVLTIPGGVLFLLLILTWIFQHQINWRYYKNNPPKLPAAIESLFARSQPWYTALSDSEKLRFNTRCALYVIAKDWISQGPDNIPEDLKYIVAYYATLVTWHQDDHLLEGFDRIVFYMHPFLTPHYKEQVHTYEVEQVDGTLIFAIDHLTAGFTGAGKFYQTGLHVMAEVYQSKYDNDYPDPAIWPTLEAVGGYSREKLEEYTGLNQSNTWPVALHHFFTFPERFKTEAGELYASINNIWQNRAV